MRTNHQTTAFSKHLFLHDTSVAVTPLSLSGAYNRAYLASAYAFVKLPLGELQIGSGRYMKLWL